MLWNLNLLNLKKVAEYGLGEEKNVFLSFYEWHLTGQAVQNLFSFFSFCFFTIVITYYLLLLIFDAIYLGVLCAYACDCE